MRFIKIFFPVLYLGLLIFFSCHADADSKSIAYWIWADVPVSQAPPGSIVYLYQGNIINDHNKVIFEHKGIYPHPLQHYQLHLVFRIQNSLPNPEDTAQLVLLVVKQWERFDVPVAGIQLDFDAPTSKLGLYSDFLQKMRPLIPARYLFSVTALADWVNTKERNALRELATVTDRMIFQLYTGRRYIYALSDYSKKLEQLAIPFSIGILDNPQLTTHQIALLEQSKNYQGTIVFLTRKI